MSLADAVASGLLECRDGRITWANPALAELAGATEARALVGRSADTLFESTGSGLPDWVSGDASRAVANGLSCELVRSDGERRAVRVRALGEGAFEVRDESSQRSLEREVHRLGVALLAANREVAHLRECLSHERGERDDLLSVVSHELQTPLTVVAGFTRLLLGEEAGPLTTEQRRFLAESERSCERLVHFVSHLVDASRQLGTAWPVELHQAPLEPTLRSVTELLRPIAQERRQQVSLKLAPDAKSARFDPPRVEQVVTNLVGNALKYGRPSGRVQISTRRLAAAGHAFVEVAVEDDGPGVPAAERSRIFEPYVRGREQGDGAGLGLGLAICRRIVDAHGGTIDVEPRDGGGSRFTFTLEAEETAA